MPAYVTVQQFMSWFFGYLPVWLIVCVALGCIMAMFTEAFAT